MPEATGTTYNGRIPVEDLYVGAMVAGQERRGQGSDFVHEFIRLGAAEDRGKMNQAQSFGYRIATEAGSGRTRAETNAPNKTGAGGQE